MCRTTQPRLSIRSLCVAAAALAVLPLAACQQKATPKAVVPTVRLHATPRISDLLTYGSAIPATYRHREPTSRELADRLAAMRTGFLMGVAEDFVPAQADLACAPGDGAVAYRCTFRYADQQHDGGNAALTYLIYDTAADIDAIDANIEANVRSEIGIRKASTPASLSRPARGADAAMMLPGHCYQSQGAMNGAATCAFAVMPRVVMLATVAPAKPFYTDGDSDSADTRRAVTLGRIGANATLGAGLDEPSRLVVAQASAPSRPIAIPTYNKDPELMRRIDAIFATYRPVSAR